MITLIFVLLSLLDFQRTIIAADGIEKQFIVSQLVEASLNECATNPQNGFNGDPITIDWVKSPESTEPNVNSTSWFPDSISDPKNATVQPMSVRVVPVDPPTPPKASTPEPPTFAILSITASTLLFLLFGQRLSRRLLRRI